MIYTITLNPCIDKTYEVEQLVIDRMNRSIAVFTDYCGKGVNVAKDLSLLGHKATVSGFLGKNDTEKYNEVLDEYGIKNDFIPIEGSTRINVKIIDLSTNQQTDVNDRGLTVTENDIKNLNSYLKNNVRKNDIVAFSGSVPPGFSFDDFKCLVDTVISSGAKLAVDSENERLEYAINSKAFAIKPNIHEYEAFLGKKLNTLDEIAEEAVKTVQSGVENVIISMGDEGCLFADKNQVLYSENLGEKCVSTTGAGDAALAGFISAYAYGKSFEECAASSLACGNACVMTKGTMPPEVSDYERLLKKVKMKKIR